MILLEVIVSIAILALGVAAIGGQMFQAQRASQRADRIARAVLLAESLIAELDSGLILPEQEQEGYFDQFGMHYDGWAWRMIIDPTQDEGMFLVTIEVYYGHPEYTTDDLDDKALIYETHMLRTEPGTVNLVDELGLDDEMLEQVQSLPGIPPDFDPENINPSQVARMLQDLLGEDGEGLADLSPEEMGALLKYVQSLDALTKSLAELGGGGGKDLLGGLEGLIPPDLLQQGQPSLSPGGSLPGGSTPRGSGTRGGRSGR
jgi:hypothetical protein